MIILRFEGYSDDTFGEIAHFKDDYDNCANGKPIRYLVTAPGVDGGIVVAGHHGRNDMFGAWTILVTSYDALFVDRPLPDWPMRIERGESPYSPALVIEAPDDVRIRCLERSEGEAS